MRGGFTDQGGLFSYIAPDKRVPANHPLRKVRELVRDVLSDLNRSLGRLYASEGRPSIPPEQLLSALLLQVFYGIRSERQLMEQLDYNLLYRWFVGLSPDDPVWDADHLHQEPGAVAETARVFTKFMTRLLNHPQVKPLLSDEHVFGGWNVDRSAGLHRRAFVRGRWTGVERDGTIFHGQKAQERHPCEYQRPGQQALSQGGRTGGQALLYGPRHHGEPRAVVAGERRLHPGRMPGFEAMLKARRKAAGRRITAGEDKAYDTRRSCRQSSRSSA